MADDDVTAERARLEALAWGAGSSAEAAARARAALRDLDVRQDPDARPEQDMRTDHDARPEPDARLHRDTRPDPGTHRASDGGAATTTGAEPAGRTGTAGTEPGSDGGAVDDGGGAGLPAGPTTWRTRARSLLWTARPRAWIALGAAAVLGLTFAAGTLVGTSHDQPAAAPSTTPSAGTVTLEELLDIPQTYADQLPGPVEAPVSLRTTRLVFTNRALDGSSFETPWNVWAGVGTDRETICLVATANRLESTTACYPREDALHGNVSLSAQSMSGTLTVTLRGGGVQGTVTNEN
ncbi:MULTISPECIES: hypothetical protein [Curtobacterium]|uniref:Uncharacterized protein n=1 Tax=Curtobacterium citri TaxID=3055139 RepID=A0ABT7T7L2_9MICO|nr:MULTISPECIES: hypothetical protein [Curtobacterium]MDM7885525.1 hypothetical protein [Curtobacterium citri]